MGTLMTTNALITAVLVAIVGKILKATCFQNCSEKLRKILLPLVLLIVGVAIMLGVSILDRQTNYGSMILQGLMASIFSQFVYDKIHDNMSKEE